MASLEIVYKKSYLRGKKVYSGNFPITVIGPIGCITAEQIAAEMAYKQHILSEEPDSVYKQTITNDKLKCLKHSKHASLVHCMPVDNAYK